MDHVGQFPAKLDLMLKAASLSRVALAHKLGVDKSLVGRWLNGSVHPTEHNLARLSAALADSLPQFRLADWHTDIADLASRHGIARPVMQSAAAPNLPGALAGFMAAAKPELEARGRAYEGFWRTSRPSVLVKDQIFHDYGMISRSDDGLVEVSISGSGLAFAGWLFPMAGNVFVFLFDDMGRTPMSLVFRGVSLPKAIAMDGILMLAALDSSRTPAALPILIERVGDLAGDRQADMESFRRIVEERPEPVAPLPRGEVMARLYRDTGTAAAQSGGDLFLMVDSLRSLTRGAGEGGLHG